jgi:phosphatidylinositol alpha-1,6-mannosyltransferase
VPADDDLVNLYQQCDIFALPNRQVGWDFEGFGIALLEAQASGKPVIAGTSGGAPETLQPGQTGELVDGQSPDALADLTIALLDNPERRAAMGHCARRWVLERFDWNVLTQRAHALFTGDVRPTLHAGAS